ncbi:MAG: universal stress protein [Halanaeroarchaeum sp.]
MYDRILVPTDGSDGTDAVLDHAIAIAGPHDATVTALYVVDERVIRSTTDEESSEVRSNLEAAGETALGAAVDRCEAAGVAVDSVVREGTPDREILAIAADLDADLIVMGNHGKSPREKVQGLGSVSEAVVTNAERPVLVVRLGE